MIVLGVDPGCVCPGFAVLHVEQRSKIMALDYGYLSLSSKTPLPNRLEEIYQFFLRKIIDWNVTHLVLETPFLGKNAANFLKLGYVRGILLMLASMHNLSIQEFAPRSVKTCVTGFGGASKEQVARVILRLFPSLEMPKKFDVTDALAVALCGAWQAR